jgi:dTDP-4-amino-4,6-dideoxygalactose transaminase
MEPAECPIATRIAGEVLSLPLHVGLGDDEVDRVATALKGHDACVH